MKNIMLASPLFFMENFTRIREGFDSIGPDNKDFDITAATHT